MTVKDLVLALMHYPMDADVYVTDDGSAHIGEWDALVSGVSDNDLGGINLEFDGGFLRNAIADSEEEND